MYTGLTSRVITASAVSLIIIIIFIVLIYLLLKKNPKYLATQFLVAFFVCIIIVGTVQMLYLFSNTPEIIIIFNKIGIESINIGLLFLLLGILVIYFGTTKFLKNRLIIILVIIVLSAVIIHFLIPDGVTMAENFEPQWSIQFCIYQIILSQSLVIFQLIYSLKIYNDITMNIRKKFKHFVMGVLMMDVLVIWAIIDNLNVIPYLNQIGIIFQICGIIGTLQLYYGMKKV
ncbi:MAG: hypothetical protein ACTSPY_02230 [Candidatus Helarchaeota archaeon]